VDIRTPLKNPFQKPKPTSIEEYYKSGKLQESILPFNEDEMPADGDLRIRENVIYRYHRQHDAFEELMRTFDEKEIPEDGALRLKGNVIYRYVKDKDSYAQVQQFPSEFMQSAEPEPPSPLGERGQYGKIPVWTGPWEYIKETIANAPQSISNLAEGMGRLTDPTNPVYAILDAQRGQIPGSAMYPETEEKLQEGKNLPPMMQAGYATAAGTSKDVWNLATAPIQLAWRALTKPTDTLREDPAGFVAGLFILKGGWKAGKTAVAKQVAKGYVETNFIHDLIDSIPNENLQKFGIEGEAFKASLRTEIPKDTKIAFKATSDAVPKSRIGQKPIQPATPSSKLYREQLIKETPGYAEKVAQTEKALADRPISKRLFERPMEIAEDAPLPKLTEEQVQAFKKKGGKVETIKEEFPLERERTFKTKARGKPDDISFHSGIPADEVVGKLIKIARQTRLGQEALNRVFQRRSAIGLGELKTEQVIADTLGKLSDVEAEAFTFVKGGLKDIELLKKSGYKHLAKDVEKPSPQLKRAVVELGKEFDKDFKILKEHYDKIKFVEDYVPQMWDIPKNERTSFVNQFKLKNPFTDPRKIPTLEEGLKAGYKLKVTNIKDIYRIYSKYKNEVIANLNLVDALSTMMDEAGRPVIVKKSTQAVPEYVEMEHPAFGLTKKAYVHPEIANELQVVFRRPHVSKVGRAYDQLNAFLKYSQLSLTLFHHGALSESALGMLGPKGLAKAATESIKRMKKGAKPIVLEKGELSADGIQHGLQLKPSSDVQLSMLSKMLSDIEGKLPDGKTAFTRVMGPKAAVKTGSKFFENWNKFLWDNLHNTLKLMSYEKLVHRELGRVGKTTMKELGRDMTKAEIAAMKKEIASFVNDSFGGQNWDVLGSGRIRLGDPIYRRNLQRIFLAPDWTISVIRQASALGRGPMKTALGKELLKQGVERQGGLELVKGKTLTDISRYYWKRMAAYSFVVMQGVNYAASEKIHGKGRFTWENPPGKTLHILVGRGGVGKNVKGEPEIYLRWGKQLSEPIRWATSTTEILGSKMSPTGSLIGRQLFKHDPGTGWPTAWARKEEKGGFAWGERIKDVISLPVPFSLKKYILEEGSGSFLFTWPLSKGMTRGKTVAEFHKALAMKDPEKKDAHIQRVAMAATENGLNWDELLSEAEGDIRSEDRWKRDKYLNKFRKELKKLKTVDEQVDLLHAYRQRETLTHQEIRTLSEEMKDRQEILKRLDNLKIEESFMKRVGKKDYRDAQSIRDSIRDQYETVRNQAIMHIRENSINKAVKLVKEWNSNLDVQMKPLAEKLGKTLPQLKAKGLYKDFHISVSQLRGMVKSEKTKTRTTPFERSIK